MYSSVKFFEPTVIVTLPLAGLDWIRLSEFEEALVSVLLVLLLLPHAAIAIARTAASNSADAARSRRPLITPYPLSPLDGTANSAHRRDPTRSGTRAAASGLAGSRAAARPRARTRWL